MKRFIPSLCLLFASAAYGFDPVILVLGRPGSGKGTFSEVAKKQGFKHISAGDLVRDEITRKTPIGIKIEEIVKRGEYLDKDLMFQLLEGRVKEAFKYNQKLIIDGYVRHPHELELIKKLLNELNKQEQTLILLTDASKQKCFERMCFRLICSTCKGIFSEKDLANGSNCPKCQSGQLEKRLGDIESVIKRRIDTFDEQLKAIYADLENSYPLIKIDANKSLKELDPIYENFLSQILEFQGTALECFKSQKSNDLSL